VALLDVILTYDCNLACDYCTIMASGGGALRGRALPFEAVISELRRGRAEDYDAVSFTGGEPTLRKDLPALVKAARTLGFSEIKIQTNGLVLAHAGNVDRLVAAGANLFHLSVHTHEEGAYDRMVRRAGAHPLMVAALGQLACRDVTLRADLIVTAETAPRLPDAVRWLDERGVRRVDLWYVSLTDENRLNVASLPRMSEAVPWMREALAVARHRGVEARSLHVPRCLLGSDAAHAYDPGSDRVKVVTPESTFTLDRSKLAGRTHVPACERGCVHRAVCPGVRPDYLETFGDVEFAPVAAVEEPPSARPPVQGGSGTSSSS
jgi:molybdenum cofactor biosynthesis enzyme MoaA